MTKIAGSGSASESGSISRRHESADPDPDPDPLQNVMDPQLCTRLHLNVDLAPGRKLFRFADLITAFPKLGKYFSFFIIWYVQKFVFAFLIMQSYCNQYCIKFEFFVILGSASCLSKFEH